jgi:hypothetical protein
MGGKHMDKISFNTAGITLIFFKRVKINQMSACPIQKKTEKLLEDLRYLLAFTTLSYLTET